MKTTDTAMEHLLLPFERPGAANSDADVGRRLADALGPDEGEPEDTDGPTSEDEDSEAQAAAGSDEDEHDDDEGDESGASEESDEESESEVDDEESAPTTIMVRGKPMTLEEIEQGVLRQDDYTRKTQAAAEERKQIEAEKASVRDARARYVSQAEALEVFLTEQMPAEPDWDKLHKENPDDFARQFAEHQLRQNQIDQVREAKQKVLAEQQAENDRAIALILQEQRVKLEAALPELGDPEKAPEASRRIAEYLKGEQYGYTDEELGQVYDHRLFVLVEKARLYDESQKKGPKIREEIRRKAEPVKVMRPGAPKTIVKGESAERRRRMDRLVRSGSVEDAAAVLGMLD